MKGLAVKKVGVGGNAIAQGLKTVCENSKIDLESDLGPEGR